MSGQNRNGGFDRRNFLHFAVYGAAVTALAPGCFMGMRDRGEKLHIRNRLDSEGPIGPKPLPPTRIYQQMPKAIVGITGVGDSIEGAVREAIMAAGGINEIERGQRVMIKPNMCGPALRKSGDMYSLRVPGFSGGTRNKHVPPELRVPRFSITTNPEVLRAVIRIVKERGAKIMVGDRSMIMTETAFKTSGFARVCREERVMAYPWTRAEYVRFHPNKRHWKNGFRIPKILTEVDHFISVPLLKHHFLADFTCCMKAYVGVCLPLDRHQEGDNALHTNNISEKIAELNLSVKPTINIVDATETLIRGGPDGMKKESLWAKPGLILASKDRVACDSVALATLKRFAAENKVDLPYVNMSVWDQPQIYYGAELGIGQADPAQITIEDIKAPLLDEIKANWK